MKITQVKETQASSGRVEVPRNGRGQPIIYLRGEKKTYSRVSSFATQIGGTAGLEYFRKMHTVIGMVNEPKLTEELLEEVRNTRDMIGSNYETYTVLKDGKKVSKMIDNLCELGGVHERAAEGTRIHEMTEAVDLAEGDEDVILRLSTWDQLLLDSYLDQMTPFTVTDVEVLIVNDKMGLAGTADRVVNCDLIAPDGEHVTRMVMDIKTGSSRYADAAAIQVRKYAEGKRYCPETHKRTTLDDGDRKVSKKWGVYMHLDQDTAVAKWYWLDLTRGEMLSKLTVKIKEAGWGCASLVTPEEEEDISDV